MRGPLLHAHERPGGIGIGQMAAVRQDAPLERIGIGPALEHGLVVVGFQQHQLGCLCGGITSGASIPDDLMAHLTEVNCQLSGHDANWLGEFDFTMNSGWMYFVNGEYMNIGMSGYFPADGDEVRLRFTLYSGADLGVGDNGEVWGDW